ncbi:MAG: hypothetical protein QF704_14485, partial [Anaerolineales bacterium]|nr:hypothetical protein [Anaerolineales bacterium]
IVFQPNDTEGRTFPNGRLYGYEAGTNTPKTIYSDPGLTTPYSEPVVADGAGRFFDLFLASGGYRLELRDQNDVVIWEQDNFFGTVDGTDISNLEDDITAAARQATQSGYTYTASGTGTPYDLSVSGGMEPLTAPLPDNFEFDFVPNVTNPANATVQVAGVTIGLRDYDGTTVPAASSFPIDRSRKYRYNGSIAQLISIQGPQESSDIALLAIQESNIGLGAVTQNKIGAKAVDGTKVADGTPNTLLGVDSSGTGGEIFNPLSLLDSGSFTAFSELEFILSSLDSSQSVDNEYLIKFIGFQPSTDDQVLYATLSDDGGTTYQSTSYYSAIHGYTANAGAHLNNFANGSVIYIAGGAAPTGGLSNSVEETNSIDIKITNINTGTNLYPYVDVKG